MGHAVRLIGSLRLPLAGRLIGAITVAGLAATFLAAQPADAATGLASGQRLNANGSITAGAFKLIMQGDGNLVEYEGSKVIFASDTSGEPGNYLLMQTDGNLVVYSAGGTWRWQTQTQGYPGARLAIQTDGNVVVYATNNTPLWAQSWRQSVAGAQQYARQTLGHYGWPASQFTYLVQLWNRESGWHFNATDPIAVGGQHAYGIPQSLPGSKMAANGPDWQTDGQTQVAWGLNYIHATYGTPQAALSFDILHGGY